MKRLIVTLGMHRAGTSAVSRGMKTLGVSLGDRLIPPQEMNNPKGFWEDADLNALNSEILEFLRHEWHYVSQIRKLDLDALLNSEYARRAGKLLSEKSDGVTLFGIKDPRLPKLLTFWQNIFERGGFSTSYVIAIRHPLSVAASLEKRDGFSIEKSLLIWAGAVINSLLNTQVAPRVVVDYDRLLASPTLELHRIASRLDLKVDRAELQTYSTEFVQHELRHSRYSESDLQEHGACPPIVKEIYTTLSKIADDNMSFDEPSISVLINAWAEEFERMQMLLDLIDRVNERNILLTPSTAWRDFEVVQLSRELHAVYSSNSWRLTTPLRAAKKWFRSRF